MTKKALERKLNELNIDKRAYDLNGGLPNETYCIEESNGKIPILFCIAHLK